MASGTQQLGYCLFESTGNQVSRSGTDLLASALAECLHSASGY